MYFSRIGRDIQSFLSGKDLVIFSIALALSSEIQTLVRTLINSLIMPFVSYATGKTNLNSRSLNFAKGDIKLTYGTAIQATIVFVITAIVMIEIARYVTVHFVKSSTVTFQ